MRQPLIPRKLESLKELHPLEFPRFAQATENETKIRREKVRQSRVAILRADLKVDDIQHAGVATGIGS